MIHSSATTNVKVTPEKFRSNFRHDLRSNFSVLIGFGEVLREDLSQANSPATEALERVLANARLLLDETIGMINLCSLGSTAQFKSEVKTGLRDKTIPDLRKINEDIRLLESLLGEHEIVSGMLEALRQLTFRCHSPFEQRIEFTSTSSAHKNQSLPSDDSSSEHRPNVMVIDDEPHNLRVIGTFLARLNLSVTPFTRAQDALNELEKGGFDLILLDLHMPGMNGIEFLRAIKGIPAFSSIPVLVVTASDDSDAIAECIEAGAIDCLPKPLHAAFFKARVLTSLELQQYRKRERKLLEQLVLHQSKIDDLLTVMLPRNVMDELQMTGEVLPRSHNEACVLICSVVDFHSRCDALEPAQVVKHLQSIYSAFEAIADLYGLQKIKTSAGHFMAAAGLDGWESKLEVQTAGAALEMIACTAQHPSGWQIKIGLHCGPFASGLSGAKQSIFDIWGATVDETSVIAEAGAAQSVTVSKPLFERLGPCARGHTIEPVTLKNGGRLELFVIEEIQRQA